MATIPVKLIQGTRYRLKLVYPAGFRTVRHFQELARFLRTPELATFIDQSMVGASVSLVSTRNQTLYMGGTLCKVFGVPVVIERIHLESLPAAP